jgi:pimeloyl-ACP methyl ester carboxylesterase
MLRSILDQFVFPPETFPSGEVISPEDCTRLYQKFGICTFTDPVTQRVVKIRYGIIDTRVPIETADDCIVYCHGNLEYVTETYTYHALLQIRRELQCPVVVFDYPGRGEPFDGEQPPPSTFLGRLLFHRDEATTIKPTEALVKLATVSVLNMVMEEYKNLKAITLWGRSLGCIPAIHAIASPHVLYPTKLRGLIIESGFVSARDVLNSECLAHLLIDENEWNNERVMRNEIGTWPCPVFIIHSDADEVIPVRNAFMLQDLFNLKQRQGEPPLAFLHLVKGRKHDELGTLDFYVELGNWYREVIRSELLVQEILSQALLPPSPPPFFSLPSPPT